MAKRKKPKHIAPQVGAPTPRIAPAGQPHPLDHDDHPVFSFRNIQGGYTSQDCHKDDIGHVLSAMERASSQIWTAIATRPHERGGLEHIPVDQLNESWPKSAGEAPDKVLVLRFTQRGRLIGTRRKQVFHVIWIDPLHKVYDP